MHSATKKHLLILGCELCAQAEASYAIWLKHAQPLKAAVKAAIVFAGLSFLGFYMSGDGGFGSIDPNVGRFTAVAIFLLVPFGAFCTGWLATLMNRRTGDWFHVSKDASGQKHIHKRCDHDSLDRHPDQPVGNSLLIPTPGMRGNPSAMIQLAANGGRVAAPIQMIGKAMSLEVELRHVLVSGVALADGYPPKFKLMVKTDDLISVPDPSIYWRKEPLAWMADCYAMLARLEGVANGLVQLAKSMKADDRSSWPAHDARVVVERLVANIPIQEFWLPKPDGSGGVEERVAQIYDEQRANTISKGARNTARRADSTR